MITYEDVKAFREAFGQEPGSDQPSIATQRLGDKLIREEVEEVQAEIANILSTSQDGEVVSRHQRANLLKELCDLVYVTMWVAAAYNLNIDAAFKEVHRSNMSKLGLDGKPIYNEFGKVMKPDHYSKAEVLAYVG